MAVESAVRWKPVSQVEGVLFFPDPLETCDGSSPLSSLPFTEDDRVFPPLGLLLFVHVGLPAAGDRASASAGNSPSEFSKRLWPFAPRGCVGARRTGVPLLGDGSAGKPDGLVRCSRAAQTFLDDFCVDSESGAVGEDEPFILGVWLSRWDALEKVLVLVIVDGVLGDESHEFVGMVVIEVADVADSAETIK